MGFSRQGYWGGVLLPSPKMRIGLGKWLQASFLDGGNEWGNEDPVHIYPRLGKFGQLRDCLDVGPGQKRCFLFQEKVCWCLCFLLRMSIQKTKNKSYTLMKGFFSSGTTEILELRAISSENKENRILHFSMKQNKVCWEVHLWQIHGGEYGVTVIWLSMWKQHRIRKERRHEWSATQSFSKML